jgi:hypothetical protein
MAKKNDLTLLFLTMNLVPWQEFHRQKLLEVIGDYPLITFSRLPMDLPGIQFRQSAEQSHEKIYRLMLEGAKLATTDYIAMVEDDMFYTKEHFELRPPLDTFGYNWNRWSLFTFDKPMFSFKRRYCNGCSILPRLLLIEALEERFAKWKTIPHLLNGELGYEKVEKNLGVTVRKSTELYSWTPVVQIHHIYGTPGIGKPKSMLKPGDTLDLEKRKTRKRHGMIRAFEIPTWGRAEDFIKHFV